MPKFTRFTFLLCILSLSVSRVAPAQDAAQFDVAVIGGTPGGIMAAVAAARLG